MPFKMTLNDGDQTRWEHDNGKSFIFLNNGELFFHYQDLEKEVPTRLNVLVGDGLVRFLAGSPDDLRTAILSLTDEYPSIALAGETAR